MINTNSTIYETFSQCAIRNKNEVAMYYEFKKFSYGHVLSKINALAKGLTDIGFKKDDVITVMLPNIPMAVYLLYAINQIGAIVDSVHPLIAKEQLKEILKKTNSRILFTLDSKVEELSSLVDDGIMVYSCSPVSELPLYKRIVYNKKNKIKKYKYTAEDLLKKGYTDNFDKSYLKDAFYLHSSGTTGVAKTVALSSLAVNSLSATGLSLYSTKSARGVGMLSVLPIFHGFGLCMGVHTSLINDTFIVLMPKFRTKQVIKYLCKDKIHTLIGVPSLYEALLRNEKFNGKKLKNLQHAFVGGDYVSESLIKRFDKLMISVGAKARMFNGYGLTETVTVCAVNTHDYNRAGSVGKAIPNVTMKIVKDGKDVGPNQEGEVYVCGPTLMNGYRFEDEAINPFYVDENKVTWIKTGDYGKMDEDGYLYFISRLKRMVKVSGISVFPNEIENEIKNLDYIYECYVKGVLDNKRGNMLKLYVVLDKSKKGQNFDKELKDLIIKKFGIYALPKEIVYMDEFPKTLVGKIDGKNLPD